MVSIFLFDTETSFELDCGIVVSLAGYALYTMQKTMGNKKKAPSKPDVEKGRCVKTQVDCRARPLALALSPNTTARCRPHGRHNLHHPTSLCALTSPRFALPHRH